MAIVLLDTDRWFPSHAEPGALECVCSRCNQLIKECDYPILAMDETEDLVARFHPECLGFNSIVPDKDPNNPQEP